MRIKFSILSAILFVTLGGANAFAEDVPDPIEPFNRGVFWFNNNVDEYVIEPVARGYRYITPDPVRTSIKNFFQNLNFPIYLVSDLLQLKIDQAGTHTGRFLVNTTVGGLGFFDVAKEWGMEPHEEDLGSAFGNWGIGPGFYLVLPLLGPSNLRDSVGFAGETFLSPTLAVTYSNMDQSTKNIILFETNALRIVNIRAGLIETIDSAKEASLDYYSFVKHAYHQNREAVIHDGMPPEDEFQDEDEPFPKD